MKNPTCTIDETDRAIIAALQVNARLTNQELADLSGVSHSSCSRRIRRLEEVGAIRGYRAQVDRDKLGLTIRAFVGVVRKSSVRWTEVASRLADIDGVVGCYVMSGDHDVLLEIVATTMKDYSETVLEKVLATEGVEATRSSFVFKEVTSSF